MRWSLEGELPIHGEYMCSGPRARWGYLILGVHNRGKRGGLGKPVHHLLDIEVERVPKQEALSRPCWLITWNKRNKRRRRV